MLELKTEHKLNRLHTQNWNLMKKHIDFTGF